MKFNSRYLHNGFQLFIILFLLSINSTVYAAYLYFPTSSPEDSAQLRDRAFARGISPGQQSSRANSAQDFWNNLRAPIQNPYFFRTFMLFNDLEQDLLPSRLDGVVFNITLDNTFYNLGATLENFRSILVPGVDSDYSINRAMNFILGTQNSFSAQDIVGFNGQGISNRIIFSARIYVNSVPQNIVINDNFRLPTTDPYIDGFTFAQPNQPLDTTTVQVIPPIAPGVFERFLSFFACGSSRGASNISRTQTSLASNGSYSCTNPKIETLQQYNANYITALNSLKITNDNVYALEAGGMFQGLVKLVPYPLQTYPYNMIVIPYYITR